VSSSAFFGDANLLAFARCIGFAFRAPGFSHPAVPPPLRAGLAFVLAPLGGAASSAPPAAAALPFALAAEVALGAALGTAASILYDGAFAGGRMLDDYAGVRGSVPSAGVAAGAGFARLWSLAFVAGFFGFGGDRLVLGTFAASFAALPPGALLQPGALGAFAAALPGALVRAALLVGGPALACVFAGQIALGVLARVVPRFSPFALSFGVTFALALLATLLGFGALWPSAGTPWFGSGTLRLLHARVTP
jgi:flagellar biosynthetic protein FliR